ncbi:hypothetical protein AAY473_040038 [Plecturocebus cupreus]
MWMSEETQKIKLAVARKKVKRTQIPSNGKTTARVHSTSETQQAGPPNPGASGLPLPKSVTGIHLEGPVMCYHERSRGVIIGPSFVEVGAEREMVACLATSPSLQGPFPPVLWAGFNIEADLPILKHPAGTSEEEQHLKAETVPEAVEAGGEAAGTGGAAGAGGEAEQREQESTAFQAASKGASGEAWRAGDGKLCPIQEGLKWVALGSSQVWTSSSQLEPGPQSDILFQKETNKSEQNISLLRSCRENSA